MTVGVQKLIEEKIEWIENNEFDKLYTGTDYQFDRADLTKTLLAAGINPLEYLTYVPEDYMNGADTTSIVVPKNIDRICNTAFYGCHNLQKVILPEGLIFIEDTAFCECTSLTSINIPSTVEYIKEDAFAESGLKHVVLPNYLKKLSRHCFEECKYLETVKLGQGTRRIGAGCFGKCESLRYVQLNNDLEEIGEYAFKECTSLKEIYIPDSVNKIGMYSFYDAGNITIICSENSYAHKYAEMYDFDYKLI